MKKSSNLNSLKSNFAFFVHQISINSQIEVIILTWLSIQWTLLTLNRGIPHRTEAHLSSKWILFSLLTSFLACFIKKESMRWDRTTEAAACKNIKKSSEKKCNQISDLHVPDVSSFFAFRYFRECYLKEDRKLNENSNSFCVSSIHAKFSFLSKNLSQKFIDSHDGVAYVFIHRRVVKEACVAMRFVIVCDRGNFRKLRLWKFIKNLINKLI